MADQGGELTTKFVHDTSADARSIYVMVQTGDDTLMPWAPENLGIDEINALKSNPALSGNALDPSKLVDAGIVTVVNDALSEI